MHHASTQRSLLDGTKLGTTVVSFRYEDMGMTSLLEEFIEGSREFRKQTGVQGAVFDRPLSREELEAVGELSTIGSTTE